MKWEFIIYKATATQLRLYTTATTEDEAIKICETLAKQHPHTTYVYMKGCTYYN